jgi:hypothetical protein
MVSSVSFSLKSQSAKPNRSTRPSHSMTANNLTLGAAKAGVPELQTFLDTYPCQSPFLLSLFLMIMLMCRWADRHR